MMDLVGLGVRAAARAAWPALLLLAAACAGTSGGGAPAGKRISLDQVAADFRPLPGWVDDDHAAAVPALLRTCSWVEQAPASKPMGSHPAAGTVADWRPACATARGLPLASDPDSARRFFEAHFTPVALGDGSDGLFTGYYEPVLHGSWVRTERHTVPLYRLPASGKNGLPSRARIAAGALAGRGLELMWVDDAVDAFFLEIQGSGRAIMQDGSVVGLSYAGQNGHSYYPIGRWLIDQGIATREEMSLQYIRRWLKEHPDQARGLMNLNPSYVFFRQRPGGIGALGARSMELTPGRSLAVDPDHVPLGPPVWLDLQGAPVPGGTLQRLVVAQDTGGAIKGPVRGDLFWGDGPEAEERAGLMKARGRFTLLVPRQRMQVAAGTSQ